MRGKEIRHRNGVDIMSKQTDIDLDFLEAEILESDFQHYVEPLRLNTPHPTTVISTVDSESRLSLLSGQTKSLNVPVFASHTVSHRGMREMDFEPTASDFIYLCLLTSFYALAMCVVALVGVQVFPAVVVVWSVVAWMVREVPWVLAAACAVGLGYGLKWLFVRWSCDRARRKTEVAS